ncbi:MAG: hypothetical protein ACLU9S_08500 [Oscillospiraceae bacterium]
MIRAADYGRALFELAWQEQKDGEIGEEMARVRTILRGSLGIAACWIPRRCPESSGFCCWSRRFPA